MLSAGPSAATGSAGGDCCCRSFHLHMEMIVRIYSAFAGLLGAGKSAGALLYVMGTGRHGPHVT